MSNAKNSIESDQPTTEAAGSGESDSNGKDDKLSIFISHRHEDKKLADVFREQLNEWTQKKCHITQSSDPRSGIPGGRNLIEEIQKALRKTHLLIFLYTVPEADWSYCMFECGIAADNDAIIIVFQFGGKAPDPLRQLVRIEYDEAGIKSFTSHFHQMQKHFPKVKGPFVAGDISDDLIDVRAKLLWEKLQVTKLIKQRRPVVRWLFLKLRLKLEPKELEAIRNQSIDENKTDVEVTEEDIAKRCVVTKESEQSALGHLGYSEKTELSLIDLYTRWAYELKKWNENHNTKHKQLDWCSEIVREIFRIVAKKNALEVSNPLKSVKSGDYTWYLPVINRAYAQYKDLEWEFHVELYRITPETAVKYDEELKTKLQHELSVLNNKQAKKINNIAIDRDLYKLYYRFCEKVDGTNEEEMYSFIEETIEDTIGTWDLFRPPFSDNKIDSLAKFYDIYLDNGRKLKEQLEKAFNSENPPEEKKKKVFALLRKTAVEMKEHFQMCWDNCEKGVPLEIYKSDFT